MLDIGRYLSDYLDVKALFTAHYPVVSDEDLIDPNFDLKKFSLNFKRFEFKEHS